MKKKSKTRTELATLIFKKLKEEKTSIQQQFEKSKNKIGYFYIDHLLPENIVQEVYHQFPTLDKMTLKKSLRENKYVGVQMNQYHPFLEEIIYAFQNEEIVQYIKEICGLDELYSDEHLYAGGISSMNKGQFLNPHLDNSHDKDRDRWRVLNLLYYVSPDWNEENGGHLELWPDGLKQKQITIHSIFNRLVVMATHRTSWHSVSPVLKDAPRNCVSNYYFSKSPLKETDKFHVTTFRGRPRQKLTNQILKIDSFLRMGIRKIFRKGIIENPHVYKKNDK